MWNAYHRYHTCVECIWFLLYCEKPGYLACCASRMGIYLPCKAKKRKIWAIKPCIAGSLFSQSSIDIVYKVLWLDQVLPSCQKSCYGNQMVAGAGYNFYRPASARLAASGQIKDVVNWVIE